MTLELRPVANDEKEILKNLLEKYDYEFSQWDKRDVNKLGLYGYRYLDHYWTEEAMGLFIVVDGKLAGLLWLSAFPWLTTGDRFSAVRVLRAAEIPAAGRREAGLFQGA